MDKNGPDLITLRGDIIRSVSKIRTFRSRKGLTVNAVARVINKDQGNAWPTRCLMHMSSAGASKVEIYSAGRSFSLRKGSVEKKLNTFNWDIYRKV